MNWLEKEAVLRLRGIEGEFKTVACEIGAIYKFERMGVRTKADELSILYCPDEFFVYWDGR